VEELSRENRSVLSSKGKLRQRENCSILRKMDKLGDVPVKKGRTIREVLAIRFSEIRRGGGKDGEKFPEETQGER